MNVVLKNTGWWALKLLVFGLTSFYLYRALHGRSEWVDQLRQQTDPATWALAATAAALIPVNWGLEAWKWWFLARKIEAVSFGRAYRSVMLGLTLGFITPNRIGDYAGRILELNSPNRGDAIGAIFLGRFAQLVITMLAGSLGLYVLLWQFYLSEFPVLKVSLGIMVLAVNLAFLFFFFKSRLLLAVLLAVRPLRRFLHYIRVLTRYSFRELSLILILALVRYLVFCFQFGFLLRAFGVKLVLGQYASGISSSFLLKSVVPSLSAITDIGMREISAMHFFSLFGQDEMKVLAASLSLWFLNIVAPSAIGLIFVFRVKLKNRS
ncbi:MAG TPA: lysylphosphatidylglycerol synthase domain-containing protein [Adhaeribacter sp.]|nr:lysylphosphatidylglycerol synthase domain-containing protein [Adhaeribacter sp.]